MPQIGEIKRARDIGINTPNPYYKFIWGRCPVCWKERWIRLLRGKPSSIHCRSCWMKQLHRRGKDHRSWKGGRIKKPNGYIMVLLQPDDFFYPMVTKLGYVMEHRLVVAKHLGRNLHRWEIVHHKNHIKDDNEFENLQLVSDDKHKQITILEERIKRLEQQNRELQTQIDRG